MAGAREQAAQVGRAHSRRPLPVHADSRQPLVAYEACLEGASAKDAGISA